MSDSELMLWRSMFGYFPPRIGCYRILKLEAEMKRIRREKLPTGYQRETAVAPVQTPVCAARAA